MRSRRFSSAAAFILILQSAVLSSALAAPQANTLGIGIDVLEAKGAGETASSMGADGSLWFIIPPGKSGTRSIRIKSVASVPMKISTSVGFGVYRNGEATFDESRTTELSKWARFSDDGFTLQQNSSRVISITFDVPNNSDIGTNLATVFITGTPLKVVKQKGTFSVPGAARVAIPVFLGVGTAAQISVNFRINHTVIKNDNGNRFAYINISNIGKTPVAPSGYIRVASSEGSIKIDTPIKIQSSTIVPGEAKDLIVLIPPYIPNGEWVFMEELQQGPIQQTAEAKISLTAPSIFTVANLLRIFFFLIFALIFYFSARYIRNKGEASESRLPPRNFFWANWRRREEEATVDESLAAIIASVNARIEREARATQKRVEKKPIKKRAKKVAAKKAVKKVGVKKSMVQKPPKKSPSKPAKKAAARKRAGSNRAA